MHPSKKAAVLSWITNICYDHDISSIKELKDGAVLRNLIHSLDNKLKEFQNSEDISSENKTTLQNELNSENVKLDETGHVDNNVKDLKENLTDSAKLKSSKKDLSVYDFHDEYSNDSQRTELNELVIDEGDPPLSSETVKADSKYPSLENISQITKDESVNSKWDKNKKMPALNKIQKTCQVDNGNKLFAEPLPENCDNYSVIQTFIDVMLNIKSADLVVYEKCKDGVELELSKLIIMLLCATVQYSLSVGDENSNFLTTSYSLQSQDQEEIMDCLELFLTYREDPVTLNEFNSRLKRSVCKSRRCSPRVSTGIPVINLDSTPKYNKKSHKRKRSGEDVFMSPIQIFLKSERIRMTPDSEDRLKKALKVKDKTIVSLQSDVDDTKQQVDEHQKKIEELERHNYKLKKELEKVKQEFGENRNEWDQEKDQILNDIESLKSDKKRLKKKVRELEDHIKFLRQDSQEAIDTEPINDIKNNPKSSIRDKHKEEEQMVTEQYEEIQNTQKILSRYNEVVNQNITLNENFQILTDKVEQLNKDLLVKKKELEKLKAESAEKPLTAEVGTETEKEDKDENQIITECVTSDGSTQTDCNLKSKKTQVVPMTAECKRVGITQTDCNVKSKKIQVVPMTADGETETMSQTLPPCKEFSNASCQTYTDVGDDSTQTDDEPSTNENFKNASSPTNVEPPNVTPKEYYVVHDWAARDEVLAKYNQSQEENTNLKDEINNLRKELETLILARSQDKEEWNNHVRNADRTREQALNENKKLQKENDILKGQIQALTVVCKEIKNPGSTERIERRGRKRKSSSLGGLWQTSLNDSLVDVNAAESFESSGIMNESNKFLPNDKMFNVKESAIGDVLCSEGEFNQIKVIVQNLSKFIREKNNQNPDVLLNLQRFEESFDSMKHLIRFLSLISEIFTDLSNQGTLSKHSKQFMEETNDESTQCLKSQYETLKKDLDDRQKQIISLSEMLHKHYETEKKLEADLESCKTELASSENKLKEVQDELQALKEEREQEIPKYQETLLRAENKIKSKNQKLAEAYEEIEKLTQKNQTLNKSLETSILKSKLKEGLPIRPIKCQECEKLRDKLIAYRGDRHAKQRTIDVQIKEIFQHKMEILNLCRRNEKLQQEKSKLEKELDDTRAMLSASCTNSLDRLGLYMKMEAASKQEESERREKESFQLSQLEEDRGLVASITGDPRFCLPRSDSSSKLKIPSDSSSKLMSSQSSKLMKSSSKNKFSEFCKIEDEADMLTQSSIAESHNSSTNRIKDLQRRNSLYLPHLKSVYALELDMTPTQRKYYEAPTPGPSSGTTSHGSKNTLAPEPKKRKLNDNSSKTSLSSIRKIPDNLPCSTPIEKPAMSKTQKTPVSLFRINHIKPSQTKPKVMWKN